MGSAAQTEVNSYLGTIAGSSLHAGEINLTVGALLPLAAVLVTGPMQLARRPDPGPWWVGVRGLVGATSIISGAILSPLLGIVTTVIAFSAGTIAAGRALEARGAFWARENPLTSAHVVGLVVTFCCVLTVRSEKRLPCESPLRTIYAVNFEELRTGFHPFCSGTRHDSVMALGSKIVGVRKCVSRGYSFAHSPLECLLIIEFL